MKNHFKVQPKSYARTCSVIAFASLLILTSALSTAQPVKNQQINESKQVNVDTQGNSQTAVVYLNNSSLAQLTTLKGIGQTKAQAIISYRNQIGAFKSVTELIHVKGIGEKILSDNKARLQI